MIVFSLQHPTYFHFLTTWSKAPQQSKRDHHFPIQKAVMILWALSLKTIQLKNKNKKTEKKKTMPILWKRQLHEQAANHWLVAIYGRKLLQWANSRLYMSQTPIMKKSRCGWRLLHNGSNPWFWFCGYYCSWLKIN